MKQKLLVPTFLLLLLPSCQQTEQKQQPEEAQPTTPPSGGNMTTATPKRSPEDPPRRVTSDPGKSSSDFLEALKRKRGGGGTDEEFSVDSFSEEEEVTVGEATARHVLQRCRALPSDAALSRYVRTVGALLSEGSRRPEIVFRFIVLEADVPDAYSAPARYVFITTGFLRFLKNEAELALVLAHEIAHVEQKHGLESLVEGVLDQEKRAARERAMDRMKRERSEAELAIERRMDSLSDMIIRGKGRPQEGAADRYALKLIAAVGYDPRVALDLYQRFGELEKPGRPKPEIFQSHPYHRERIRDMEEILRALPQGGERLADRYRSAIEKP